MRKFAIVLLLAGLSFVGYSGYQIWSANQIQKDALVQAEELVSQNEKNNFNNEIKSIEDTVSEVIPDDNDSIRELSGELKEEPFEFKAEIGEEIGMLILPTIDAKLPIIEGVGENELDKGVGHYDGTSFPSEPGQVVLSGHRDTVFRRMGELEIGDELIVKMPYGKFTYVMEKTEIVSADDLTVIRPHAYDEEVLTVTTCYPFRYVGNAPDRYIIYAKPKLND